MTLTLTTISAAPRSLEDIQDDLARLHGDLLRAVAMMPPGVVSLTINGAPCSVQWDLVNAMKGIGRAISYREAMTAARGRAA